MAQGEAHYFTGKPCPNGHIAPRFVSNYGCSECLRERCREYHAENLERERERSREYARRDPAGNTARSSRWYHANLDKARESLRLRRATDGGAHRRKSMEWYRSNPEKAAAQRRLRRARLKAAPGQVTAEDWEAIKRRYGHKCLRCGRTDQPLTMDHVVPLVHGGAHDPENVQPLCGTCNRAKHTDSTDYRPEARHADLG